MFIAFLLSIGILIGAGFVLALQWVLKKEKKKQQPGEDVGSNEEYVKEVIRDSRMGRLGCVDSDAMKRLRDSIEVHADTRQGNQGG